MIAERRTKKATSYFNDIKQRLVYICNNSMVIVDSTVSIDSELTLAARERSKRGVADLQFD